MLLESLLSRISEFLILTTLKKSEPSSRDVSLDALKTVVGDRLHATTPFSTPCFVDPKGEDCRAVKANYVDEAARARHPAAYIQTQWETCQRTHEQCLVDHNDGDSLFENARTCAKGSISDNHIDVRSAEDVQAAFKYSRVTGVPLIIQNTGHDYKGRSSAPGSLGLWMHNLKSVAFTSISFDPDFKPSGCVDRKPQAAVTVGAGVQWGEAYEFAEKHNITLVGGADKTVGVAGGWLQGGGHSALSNTMGLGVDRVLQFKVVTPDGRYRITNECQNEDLFFALRGGGGGTFGVVMEASILASPRVTLQTVILKFPRNTTFTLAMWHMMVDNGLKWANDGWGGFAAANVLVLVNPRLNKEEVLESLAPLIAFGTELQNTENGRLIVTEFPSWGSFFKAFTRDHVASVGSSLALASRLVGKSNFATPDKRNETVTALLTAEAATPGLIILLTAPSSVPSSGMTSVTDAWHSSLYHVTVVGHWSWNATIQEKKAQYDRVSASIDNLRKITPDAAYVNEADINEANHEGLHGFFVASNHKRWLIR
ncbi:hypothetical protein D9619_007344 [Psilocybe cf. subviscida]|uniref:FAD-binding PCMH-type domain-containing protein n=1 Tax=Psilocybe cf. subviscida TaxID=2480587 RepID=A0A8H5B2K7_9AGAR|nr:hypothetical protein D9619_007344 [Psilocybe cf. subviscida]